MIPGMILLWSGSVGSIPSGFHLCDGTAGTPDLRDRFIVGAGSSYNPDDAGGAASHVHAFSGDGHTHYIPENAAISSGTAYSHTTSEGYAEGSTDSTDHRPPYYALCYIMFL